jgi:[acyl-carrier-protein] S-malonyltransferase
MATTSALLFPGQGSQHLGMGRFLFDEFAQARQVFEEASDAISVDMKKLCFNSDEATLALTENTQPALLTVSIATYQVLNSILPLNVAAGAGHSVGEYAALVAAGVISLKDGVALVRQRGRLMQEAVPVGEGGMLAVIGMTESEVRAFCAWAEKESGASPIEPANFNSPDQIVVSGNSKLIEWARENFKPETLSLTKKIRMIPLKVSAPFHCSMMKPAEENMANYINNVKFSNSQFPVVQNVTAQWHSQPDELRSNILAQISQAVRWTQSVEEILKKDVNRFIECGCGKVLTGLLKKIDTKGTPAFNMNSLEDIKLLEQSGAF